MNTVFNSKQRGLGWMLILPMVLATAAGAAEYESRKDHKEYDFHYDIRYPGRLRSDTSYDKVRQKKGDIKEYNRRVVEWWPKRGLDVTPIEDIAGAPKRTWTPVIPDDTWSHTLLDNFPAKPFEAHLVGFRGVGDDALADVNDPNSFRCPTPVLLLPDGRKRAILAKYLSPKDRRFLIDIYNQDQARIAKTLVQEEYLVSPDVLKKHPIAGEGELHKDHEFVRFDSKHFAIVVPGKPPATGKSWVRKEDHKQVMETIRFLENQFEAYWAYHEYSGALVRYWENEQLYKYKPTVFHGGGGGGGGYGGCTLGGPRPGVVFHEWGHGMKQGGLAGLGGYEASADAMWIMGDPSNIKRAGQWVARPWKNLFHGSYRGGGGYEILADDPNWGYAVTPVLSALASDGDYTPMHVLAHIGEERGLWEKGQGIKGMGDLIGQLGARFAEFDCIQEFQFRGWFGSANRSCLVPVDTARGIYRCPSGEAPEPFGVNISRLVADPGATQLTVDFQGQYDPDTYSDWRACIVAVGSDFRCRYSPLWNKGTMSMDVKPGDKRYWLAVTATPKALLHTPMKGGAHVVYQGGFAYRYPYQVTLAGCTAGSAYASPVDNNNSKLAAPEWTEAAVYGDLFEVPAIMTGTEKKQFRKEAESVLAYATRKKTAIEREYAAANATALVHERWGFRWSLDMLDALIERVGILTENLDGGPHENGGGWISANAYAAPTAYVGKNCYVMNGARVLDNAILLDSAVVRGPGAVVKDNAKLSGKAAIIGDVVAGGFARVNHPIINHPHAWVADTDRVVQYVDGTPRDGLFEKGLVANYGCLRPEAVLLEDLLINRSIIGSFEGAHMTKTPTRYDGYMVGTPGFDLADGSGAFVFNGKDQYAELPPDAVDFGQLVLVLRIKPTRLGAGQTLFEFGSSLDNRLTLTLDAQGTPTLSWHVAKNKVAGELVGSAPLAADRWATLRVDMDGRSASLYLNDKRIAQTGTSFRPADVFVPGMGRRNFLFRNRDDAQPDYFAGKLDYLRVYSHVPRQYKDLPAMPIVSPTKAMSGILEYFESTAPKKREKAQPGDRSIHIELKNGWMHNKYTWNDRLQEHRSLFDWKPDDGASVKMLELRDQAYALESQYLLKRFELKKEFLTKNPKLEAALRRSPAAREPSKAAPANPKLAALEARLVTIRSSAEERVRVESRDTAEKIELLRKKIAARREALATKIGPVAEAFAPVLKEYQARLNTAKDPEAVKREVEELLYLRDSMLVRRVNDRVPPSGLWYLDEELRSLREQLASAERLLGSLRDQILLGDSQYQSLMSQANSARISTRSDVSNAANPHAVEPEAIAIPEFQEYRQQNAELAALHVQARQAAIDWYGASTEIMYQVVPPEYYYPNDMVLKNRKFTVASSDADLPYFHQFYHPSDRLGQLKAAVEWQANWAETCDDWDTRQSFEKDYDKQTDRIKQWLKRVKPYRYGTGDAGASGGLDCSKLKPTTIQEGEWSSPDHTLRSERFDIFWGDKRSSEPWKDVPTNSPSYFDPREIMKIAESYWTTAVDELQVYRADHYVPRDRIRIVIKGTWTTWGGKPDDVMRYAIGGGITVEEDGNKSMPGGHIIITPSLSMDPYVLTHELTHALQTYAAWDTDPPGPPVDAAAWKVFGMTHESHATFIPVLAGIGDGKTKLCVAALATKHLRPGLKRPYQNWTWMQFLCDKENPRFYCRVIQDHRSLGMHPFESVKRRKEFSAKQFADYWFDHAQRNVTGDYTTPNIRLTIERMRKDKNPLTVKMLPVAGKRDTFEVPTEFVPQRFAYNHILLRPEGRAEGESHKIGVKLQGKPNEDKSADWRFGFCVITRDDKPRYVGPASDGELATVNLAADDKQVYLVVMATPDHLSPFDSDDPKEEDVPRYPYTVKIQGAVPD